MTKNGVGIKKKKQRESLWFFGWFDFGENQMFCDWVRERKLGVEDNSRVV